MNSAWPIQSKRWPGEVYTVKAVPGGWQACFPAAVESSAGQLTFRRVQGAWRYVMLVLRKAEPDLVPEE